MLAIRKVKTSRHLVENDFFSSGLKVENNETICNYLYANGLNIVEEEYECAEAQILGLI